MERRPVRNRRSAPPYGKAESAERKVLREGQPEGTGADHEPWVFKGFDSFDSYFVACSGFSAAVAQ